MSFHYPVWPFVWCRIQKQCIHLSSFESIWQCSTFIHYTITYKQDRKKLHSVFRDKNAKLFPQARICYIPLINAAGPGTHLHSVEYLSIKHGGSLFNTGNELKLCTCMFIFTYILAVCVENIKESMVTATITTIYTY